MGYPTVASVREAGAPNWDGMKTCRAEGGRVPVRDHDHELSARLHARLTEMGPGVYAVSPDLYHMLLGWCCEKPITMGCGLRCDPTLPPNSVVRLEGPYLVGEQGPEDFIP